MNEEEKDILHQIIWEITDNCVEKQYSPRHFVSALANIMVLAYLDQNISKEDFLKDMSHVWDNIKRNPKDNQGI